MTVSQVANRINNLFQDTSEGAAQGANINGVPYTSILINNAVGRGDDPNLISNGISNGNGTFASYQRIGIDAGPDRGSSGFGPFTREIFGFNYFRLGMESTNPRPSPSNQRRVLVIDGSTRELLLNITPASAGTQFPESTINQIIAAVNSVEAGGPSDPFEEWAAAQNIPEDLRAEDADADDDGLNNLLEYAFGSNPIISDASTTGPRVVNNTAENRRQFVFQRSKTADVEPFTFMSSTTLDDFTSFTPAEGDIIVTDQGDTELVTIVLPSGQERFFVTLSTARP